MRKIVNVISVIIYILASLAAIYFGWENNYLISGICLASLLLIGLIRFIILACINKKQLKNYIPLRSVNFDNAVEIVDGKEVEPVNKVALIHIDKVDKDKVIIKLFKEPVSISDCSAEINK